MNKDVVYVYVDLEGKPYLVGKLWHHYKNGRESTTFAYEQDWLSSPKKFSLELLLQLTKGTFHTGIGKTLFGAIGDSAPDRWGRVLMRRYCKERASSEGKESKTLTELDYLLMVSDEVRQGALRFKKEIDGSFLAERETMKSIVFFYMSRPCKDISTGLLLGIYFIGRAHKKPKDLVYSPMRLLAPITY